MCVYIYTYMYRYIYIYMYTHMCICSYIYIHTNTTSLARARKALATIRRYVPADLRRVTHEGQYKQYIYIYTHIQIYVDVCIYTYIYIYTYTYTHMKDKREFPHIAVCYFGVEIIGISRMRYLFIRIGYLVARMLLLFRV